MRNYEERAKDFIQKVFPFIENANYPKVARENIAFFNMQFHRKVQVSAGIARIALITSDYVVKFDYDEDNIEYVGGCESEIEMYAQAEADGFEYLFAKITRFDYNGKAFYIMPRIKNIHSDSWNYAQAYMTQEELQWCNDHSLTDLHSNNYGFRNGHVCIFDYACTDPTRSY